MTLYLDGRAFCSHFFARHRHRGHVCKQMVIEWNANIWIFEYVLIGLAAKMLECARTPFFSSVRVCVQTKFGRSFSAAMEV